jgi:hypothetical protein
MQNNTDIFKGRKASLLTMHKKEQVIKPALGKALGCVVLVESNFNTDSLGTFTLDIPRQGSQLDAARTKAEKGMELLGTDLGLASEGSFGSHPMSPFIPWNREIVIFIDKLNKLEIVGEHGSTETNFNHTAVKDFKEAEAFAKKVGFPEHFLVVSYEKEQKKSFIKGISSWEELAENVATALKNSTEGTAFIETDMRAHANPTRMNNILKATENLIQKLQSYCPSCGVPGFSITEHKRGLPCEWCGRPTRLIAANIYRCAGCNFTMEKPSESISADAGHCEYCNP